MLVSSVDTTERSVLDSEPVVGVDIPTAEEQALGVKIRQRWLDMDESRPAEQWANYMKQYEAQITMKDDGSASVNKPIEFEVAELVEAHLGVEEPRFTITAKGKDDLKKKEAVEIVLDHVKNQDNTSAKMREARLARSIFGTCVWYEGVEMEERIMNFPDVEDPFSMDVKFKKKKQKFLNIGGRPVDIRNFWVDDRATKWEDAIDCVEEEEMSVDEFRLRFSGDQGYKYVESIISGELERREFTTDEERQKGEPKGMIKIWYYYNKFTDQFITIANETTVIRESFIPFNHKKLPYAVGVFFKNYMSVYGRGVCQVLQSTKSTINDMRELYEESTKYSNQTVLLARSGALVDSDQMIFDKMAVWEVEGNGDLPQELKVSPPDGALLNYLGMLNEDIVTETGINPRETIDTTPKTAFEAGLREQTKLLRIKNLERTLSDFYQQVYELRLMNTQQFFPTRFVRELLEVDKDGKAIEKGEATFPHILLIDKVEKISKGSVSFKDSKGVNTSFEVKPEYLQGQLDIQVDTASNRSLLKEIDRARAQEEVNAISTIFQLFPELQQKVDGEQVLEDLFRTFDKDPEKLFKKQNNKQDNLKLIEDMTNQLGGQQLQTNRPAENILQQSQPNPVNV